MVLFIYVRTEGKSEINYKKKKKTFPPFGRFFDHFVVVSLPKKMIRKCFGCEEKE